jgi:hypothetical protein
MLRLSSSFTIKGHCEHNTSFKSTPLLCVLSLRNGLMFLFTTPTSATDAPVSTSPVKEAVRKGAERTGVPFDALVQTAERESALNPKAQAPTSSAKGLFQFIEQTWLSMVKGAGAKHGLEGYADSITQRSDGRLNVADPALRQKILDLREDPEVSSVMAGELTKQNHEKLSEALGRSPTQGELYAAHVLGSRGASELILAAQNEPTRSAAAQFPEAAGANRNLFYDKSGRARGLGELYAVLTTPRTPSEGKAAPQDTAIALTPVVSARANEPAMYGLFRTEGRRGPVSEAVAKLWSGQPARGVQTASLNPSPYYPRGDDSNATAGAVTGSVAAVNTAVKTYNAVNEKAEREAPAAPLPTEVRALNTALPPERRASAKRSSAMKNSTPAAGENDLAASSSPPRSRAKSRRPLDLSQFMVWRSS